MSKSISIFLFGILVIASFNLNGQDQLERDIRKLHYTIDGFIQKTDGYFKGRKSEAILMILEIDSSGSVTDIHLLVDNNNIDSTYIRLQKMRPLNFEGIIFVSWKDQILNLPIYSLSGLERDTSKQFSSGYVENSIIHISTTIKSRGAVLIRPLYYMTLGPKIEEGLPQKAIKISDRSKKD